MLQLSNGKFNILKSSGTKPSFHLLYTPISAFQTILEHLSPQQLAAVVVMLDKFDNRHHEYPGDTEAVLGWLSIADAW
jgi:hypothetical protein